jgi:predicted esterase
MFRAYALKVLCAAIPPLAFAGCDDDPVPFEIAVEWAAVPTPTQGTVNVAFVRPRNEGAGPHPVIFALPWGSGNEDLTEGFVNTYWLTEGPARGYYVVAPAVLGSGLESNADEIIPAVFDWMASEFDFDPDQVAIVGASNGGRGMFFAALSQPGRFQALVGLPGQYSGPAADLSVLAGKPIWLMVGEEDTPWLAASEVTVAKLDSVGIAAELDTIVGQGHVLALNLLPLLDGIDAALGR